MLDVIINESPSVDSFVRRGAGRAKAVPEFAIFALCGAMCLLAACSTAPREPEYSQNMWAACTDPQGTCHPGLVPDLSIELLRSKGSEIEVDCDLDFIDYSAESAYADCEKNVLVAMHTLVARWPDRLLPVLPDELTYSLADMGCFTFVDGDCACPYQGSAKAPLKWRQEKQVP